MVKFGIRPMQAHAPYRHTNGKSATRMGIARRMAISVFLECVSSGTIRKFEWILRQFKEETRRLSSAKSRVDDAEMAEKTPKLRIKEFLRHALEKASHSLT